MGKALPARPAVCPGWAIFVLLATAIATAQATTLTRTAAFEYDPVTGQLLREIIEPDQPQLRLETSYTYDAYGNRLGATLSSPATGLAAIAPRTSTTAYDARGQFPIASRNALGHAESRVFDAKFGLLRSHTGPNGLGTHWDYDPHGRKTGETRADGTRTTWSQEWCDAACPPLARYRVRTRYFGSDGATEIGAASLAYYDARERLVRTEHAGFDGTPVYQDTEYDRLGRPWRYSLPYFRGQEPAWTSLDYDRLGRPLRRTRPDGSHEDSDYSGLRTRHHNALGQATTLWQDSQGQVQQVTDATGKNLFLEYDPFGNPIRSTDPQGNTYTMTYDGRGRKTGMADPDLGTWNYVVDALGQLKQVTNARGQTSSMRYDGLGRLSARSDPDLRSSWTYDDCSMGVGRLCSAASDNGYRRRHAYDRLGRPSSTLTGMADASYAMTLEYDPLSGRVARQTWPSGLAVSPVYNRHGYLEQLREGAGQALLWRADRQDAQGRLLQQTQGNGIVTQQSFDPLSGRLVGRHAGPGNAVQDLAYAHDAAGNLLARRDGTQNLVESFQYDRLNRLQAASLNAAGAGMALTEYSYDSLGNLAYRSDLGSYRYGPRNQRPHAVLEVALAGGGQRHYSYDGNGNLTREVEQDAAGQVIAGRGKAISYTSFDLPAEISGAGASLRFAYGPEHQRLRQDGPGGTTWYLHPDNTGGLAYEREVRADGTEEQRHFITAGNQVVALVKQVGAARTVLYLHRDHLGSTSAVTDGGGAVLERLAYEPFGRRRFPDGVADPDGTLAGIHTDRGYTNHEHLDELGLVHMNGRIYDPALGRFLSADPFIQSVTDLQAYNRYAYVSNNPLLYTDPSGYFKWRKVLRAIVAVAVAVFAPEISAAIGWTGGISASGAAMAGGGSLALGITNGAVAAGMLGGAVSGAVLGGDLKSAALGALAGGAFGYVGGYGGAENVAGHAAVGCAASALQGGSCGSGALSAGFGALATMQLPEVGRGEIWGVVRNGVAVTVIGGTASTLGGDKFGNGAMTAAFGYLFNALQHVSLRAKSNVKPYLDDEFYPRVKKFFGLLEGQGIYPTVTDAFRTAKDQLDRTKTSSYGAAQVGNSLHEAGFAIDIDLKPFSTSQHSLIVGAAQEAGLSWGGTFRKYDPVHFYHDPGNRSQAIPAAQQRYREMIEK